MASRSERARRAAGFTLVVLPAVSKRKRAAFTLVELLVVIGIIGVLISILMPTLSRARAMAQRTQCLSNMRQISQILQLYANQYKQALPAGRYDNLAQMAYWATVGNPDTPSGEYTAIGLLIQAGLISSDGKSDEAQLLFCPASTAHTLSQSTGLMGEGSTSTPWVKGDTRLGYAQNPIWAWIPLNPALPAQRVWVYGRSEQISNTYADEDPLNPSLPANAATAKPFIPKVKDWKGLAILGDLVIQDQHYKQGHKGGMNVLYSDWRAQWVPLEMLQPEWGKVNWSNTSFSTSDNIPYHRLWRKLNRQIQ